VDTLRAWERRYRIVRPARDDRGRVYSDADVRRLQLLAAAVARGHAIGRLSSLDDAAVSALLEVPRGLPGASLPADPAAPRRRGRGAAAPVDAAARPAAPIGRVLAALRRFDASEVERELGRLAAALPPRELVHEWVVPLMRQTGREWHAGRLSTAQEHLLSAALRSLLGAIIRAMPQGGRRPNLLLATLARDRHEFGILGAAMLAALSGLRVTYLGCDLPADEIVDAARRSGAAAVVLGITYAETRARTAGELERVTRRLPAGTELWVGGPLAPELAGSLGRVVALADFTAFEAGVARLGGSL
jgi:methylmalonyl-CoA mutase cobalamin-binding subunit